MIYIGMYQTTNYIVICNALNDATSTVIYDKYIDYWDQWHVASSIEI